MSDLARELLKLDTAPTLGYAIGTVTATVPLTVQLNGDDTGDPVIDPPAADSYTPTIGDTVFVLRPGPTVLVLCKIA